MTTPAEIAIGAAVLVTQPARSRQPREEGVVVEVVKPGRLPRAFVRGGPGTKADTRYVVATERGHCLRFGHQLGVVAP